MILQIRRVQALQRESDIRGYDDPLGAMYPSFAEASASQRREWIDGGLRPALIILD